MTDEDRCRRENKKPCRIYAQGIGGELPSAPGPKGDPEKGTRRTQNCPHEPHRERTKADKAEAERARLEEEQLAAAAIARFESLPAGEQEEIVDDPQRGELLLSGPLRPAGKGEAPDRHPASGSGALAGGEVGTPRSNTIISRFPLQFPIRPIIPHCCVRFLWLGARIRRAIGGTAGPMGGNRPHRMAGGAAAVPADRRTSIRAAMPRRVSWTAPWRSSRVPGPPAAPADAGRVTRSMARKAGAAACPTAVRRAGKSTAGVFPKAAWARAVATCVQLLPVVARCVHLEPGFCGNKWQQLARPAASPTAPGNTRRTGHAPPVRLPPDSAAALFP